MRTDWIAYEAEQAGFEREEEKKQEKKEEKKEGKNEVFSKQR